MHTFVGCTENPKAQDGTGLFAISSHSHVSFRNKPQIRMSRIILDTLPFPSHCSVKVDTQNV